ncbi:MAG: uroporphyrinogen decarboxylase family protein, partial [Candidatus Brocadiaceae bacterium]
ALRADGPTPRERWIGTLKFERPDRIPFQPGWPRESTRRRWHAEGLPEDRNWREVLCEEIGVDLPRTKPRVAHGVSFRMMPQFEEKILEHRDGHYVVQDWKGNICEISDEFDPRYLRNAIDFVTRKWIKLPVEDREGWEEMKRRYEPEEPGRVPEDFEDRCRRLSERDYVSTVAFPGPFWQVREWVGFERLCMLFIDDPDFLREMIGFWTHFVSRTLAPLLEARVVDHLFVSEDMAFKEKPMISPAMAREFLKPAYDRWIAEAREGGVAIIDMDSDGRVDQLIPVWIEAGFDVCDPMEVAAGNDIVALRERFGRRMAYRGGVDKRAIAKGGKAVARELERVAPVARDGGYIPGCDHGVPNDVSWPNFVHYARLLAELTGWG